MNTGTRVQVQLTASSGRWRILRDSLRYFFSSSVSPIPSSTIDPAMGRTLWAMGPGNFTGAGPRTAEPSRASASAAPAVADTWSASSATPSRPPPETAWKVVTTRERRPASSWSGLSTGMATIVVQLGLATMPLGMSSRSAAFTSGTTSGTRSSMRQALELSTTMPPAAAMAGEMTFDEVAPAALRAMSMPEKSAPSASSTVIDVPR